MIIYDEPIEQYHCAPQLSNSKLVDFAVRGPRFFAARHVTRTSPPLPSKEHQIFGQAFEDLLCEPDTIRQKYALKPKDMTFSTKEGKAWRAEQEAAGRKIIKEGELDAMYGMRQAFFENETAVAMVRAARQQATIRAPYAGTPGLQARPDWLCLEGCAATGFEPYSLDLKTTAKLPSLTSGRSVADLRYDCQASIVRETLRLEGHHIRSFLLACEKSAPYRCVVIELPPAWTGLGWAWAERQLARLAVHYRTNEWPRVPAELVRLPEEPPRYLAKRSDEIEVDEDDDESEAA